MSEAACQGSDFPFLSLLSQPTSVSDRAHIASLCGGGRGDRKHRFHPLASSQQSALLFFFFSLLPDFMKTETLIRIYIYIYILRVDRFSYNELKNSRILKSFTDRVAFENPRSSPHTAHLFCLVHMITLHCTLDTKTTGMKGASLEMAKLKKKKKEKKNISGRFVCSDENFLRLRLIMIRLSQ